MEELERPADGGECLWARPLRGWILAPVRCGTRITGVRETLEPADLPESRGLVCCTAGGRLGPADERPGVTRDGAIRVRDCVDLDGARVTVGVDVVFRDRVDRALLAAGRCGAFAREREALPGDEPVDRRAPLPRLVADFARGLLVDRAARVVRLPDPAFRVAFDDVRFGGAPAKAAALTSDVAANIAPINHTEDLCDVNMSHPQSVGPSRTAGFSNPQAAAVTP